MDLVRCVILRWIGDEPQPGWAEASLTDVHGRTWLFHDKPPIFSGDIATPATRLPMAGALRCEITGRRTEGGKQLVEVATIDTDSVDGRYRFEVSPDQITGAD